MRGNFFSSHALAKAGYVLVVASGLFSSPPVVRAGDPRDLFPGELTVDAIHEVPHFAGIDEKRLSAPVAKLAVPFVSSKKPQAGWNLRAVEELRRQSNHAVH